MNIRVPEGVKEKWKGRDLLAFQFGENSVIDAGELMNMGLIKRNFDKIKILGDGHLTKSLTVKANMFSKSAIEKIQAVGGKAEVI